MTDPGSIPFQTAATVGQAVDRLTRRWRTWRGRRAGSLADEQWLSTLAALKSEVHAEQERASSD